MEVELLEWREKYKYLNERNQEVKEQLGGVTKDMTHLAH